MIAETASLAMSDVGAGRPVLLLHGAPIPAQHFEALSASLRKTRRVLIPDLPGYGTSAPLTGEYTLERVTGLVENELSRRGIDACDVVGHSLGAYRAFALALGGRIRVGALVSLNGFAGLEPEAAAGYAELAAALRGGMDIRALLVERALAPEYARQHPEHEALCQEYLRQASMDVYAAELAALAQSEDLRPRLQELDCSLTLRAGALDAAVPCAWSEDIARRMPSAQLQMVPDAGHMLLLEDESATWLPWVGRSGAEGDPAAYDVGRSSLRQPAV